RSSPLLFGYRNTPEVDVAALEETLLRVGLLAEHVPEVAEFDANPVIASPTGATVVDAKLHLVRAPAEPRPSSVASAPSRNQSVWAIVGAIGPTIAQTSSRRSYLTVTVTGKVWVWAGGVPGGSNGRR